MHRLKKTASFCLLVLVCVAMAGTPVFAKPDRGGKGPGRVDMRGGRGNHGGPAIKHRSGPVRNRPGHIRGGISRNNARFLAREHHLSGYRPLPPGLRSGLVRGRVFPHGIERHPLPVYYTGRLPVRAGYEWYAVGRDLVLMSIGGAIIADVITDVFD